MKQLIIAIFAIIWIILLAYLLLPIPKVPPLHNSLRSTEEGDTVQIPGVQAYYTDYKRQEVVSFYQKAFSRSPLLNLPFFQITLNHPVEYPRQVIRDPFWASYVEEIVHPFRESLLIAGWEPVNAPSGIYPENERAPIIVSERQFFGKATLRLFNSNPWHRLLIFILASTASGLIFYNFKKILTT